MYNSGAKKALDIRYILFVLRERIKIMALVFISASLPILAVSFLVSSTYEVKTILMIEQVPMKMPFYQEALIFRSRPEGVNLHKHSIMLRGSAIASLVARSLSDTTRSFLIGSNSDGAFSQALHLITSWAPISSDQSTEPTQTVEAIISKIFRSTNLITVNTRAPNIIELASYAADPRVAFEVVSQYIEVYSAENLANNRKDVSRALDFVRQQWTQAEAEFQQAQLALLTTKRSHDIVTSSTRVDNLALSAQLNHLEYRATLAQEKYNMLSKKLMEAEIQFAEISNNIRVVNPPELPVSPSGRVKVKIRLLAVLAGLLFGLSAAFIVEFFRDLVNSEDDLEADLRRQIVAIIPNLDGSP